MAAHRGPAGFETVFFGADGSELLVEDFTTALEGDEVWSVRSEIRLDHRWRSSALTAWSRSPRGSFTVHLHVDASGAWHVEGVERPDLDGCVDVDLESSACTNSFPVRRLGLPVGGSADAPAVYVRAGDLAVYRIEQHYTRLDDDDGIRQRYAYRSPTFDFDAVLVFDAAGLALDYPGLAVRER